MQKIKVIAVVGPTASGKTKLAVEIAKKYDGEVVSVDSMQIYRGMNIASAKPTKAEMQGVIHHLIDCKDLTERYSVGLFLEEAKAIIFDIASRNKLPVICGGTGLYIDSLIENVEFVKSDFDEELRNKLNKRLETEGAESLYNELKTIDGEYAEKIDINNTKRVLRALELFYSSGVKMSEQLENSKTHESPFDALFIGLNFTDRQKLYDRINLRVEQMLERGLIDEAKDFYKTETNSTSNQAIGIKELKVYLDGNESLGEATDNIKKQTRHYAKRQLTWFNRNKNINWIYPDACKDVEETAFSLINEFLKRSDTDDGEK